MMINNKILSITLIVFLVGLSAISVFVVGIYKFDWENAAAKKFAQIVPLPAAVVAGGIVRLSDFWKLEGSYKSLTGADAPKSIAQDLIRDKIIEILSKDKNIAISSEELERYYLYLLAKFGLDKNTAQEEITRLFEMAESDFKRLVVLQDLRRIKLMIWWQEQSRPNPSWKRMGEAEKTILEGLTFQEAARIYSDDEESKYIGGDLGFLRPEEIEPWFLDAVSNLKIGDISRIEVGPDGYYLFQVAARGQDLKKTELQVKQIFVKNEGFEEFLEEESQRYRAWIFKGF